MSTEAINQPDGSSCRLESPDRKGREKTRAAHMEGSKEGRGLNEKEKCQFGEERKCGASKRQNDCTPHLANSSVLYSTYIAYSCSLGCIFISKSLR